jgi:hypothetical protein
LEQKFRELIEDEETFLKFLRLYAPGLLQKLQQNNVMWAHRAGQGCVCIKPKGIYTDAGKLRCSDCGGEVETQPCT